MLRSAKLTFCKIFQIKQNNWSSFRCSSHKPKETNMSKHGRKVAHSNPTLVQGQKMTIDILPALDDNFMYLIIDEETKEAAIVDPVNTDLVSAAVEKHKVDLKQVLTTHHHWDHAGGNDNMKKVFAGVKIIGGSDKVLGITDKVAHGDVLKIGKLKVECLATPCHTTDHICYYLDGDKVDPPAVFTGDTLFAGGCGRFFEGSPQQMIRALIQVLGNLPDETRVFCGHEYTCKNLEFGLSVEGLNEDIKKKLEWAKEQRKNKDPTVPSTIADEKKTNPFMRIDEKNVISYTKVSNSINVMEALREAKNKF